jgi:uncharacterized protein
MADYVNAQDAAEDDQRPFYTDEMRSVQDRFDGRRLADRLEQITLHREFSDHDRALIEGATMVYLATSDSEGWPDCSYKGGHAGFVRLTAANELSIAIYDGNSQYRTLGNISGNPRVGLLFIDFAKQARLRVNGTARIVGRDEDASLVDSFPGAQVVVTVRALQIFPNCGRYVHDLANETISEYAPTHGYTPPEPEWKSREMFADAMPRPVPNNVVNDQ